MIRFIPPRHLSQPFPKPRPVTREAEEKRRKAKTSMMRDRRRGWKRGGSR